MAVEPSKEHKLQQWSSQSCRSSASGMYYKTCSWFILYYYYHYYLICCWNWTFMFLYPSTTVVCKISGIVLQLVTRRNRKPPEFQFPVHATSTANKTVSVASSSLADFGACHQQSWNIKSTSCLRHRPSQRIRSRFDANRR